MLPAFLRQTRYLGEESVVMSNPYQATDMQYDPRQPSVQRSNIPVVFGILNCIFGALGVFGICFGIIGLALVPFLANQPNAPQMDFPMMEGNMKILMIISIAISAVLTVVLLVAGYGLLKYREYGRKLSIYYGAITIVTTILQTIATLVLAANTMQNKDLTDEQQASQFISMVSGGVGGCVGLIYPIVLLVFMYHRSCRESVS
jgi:heme/copper-type cytochrome/quinol oxidase subunit 2